MAKNCSRHSVKGNTKKNPKRRGWTTDEQFNYLNNFLPTFKTAQVKNMTQEMWLPIKQYRFTQWPLGAATEDEVKQGLTNQAWRKRIMEVSGLCLFEVHVHTYPLTVCQNLVRKPCS